MSRYWNTLYAKNANNNSFVLRKSYRFFSKNKEL